MTVAGETVDSTRLPSTKMEMCELFFLSSRKFVLTTGSNVAKSCTGTSITELD